MNLGTITTSMTAGVLPGSHKPIYSLSVKHPKTADPTATASVVLSLGGQFGRRPLEISTGQTIGSAGIEVFARRGDGRSRPATRLEISQVIEELQGIQALNTPVQQRQIDNTVARLRVMHDGAETMDAPTGLHQPDVLHHHCKRPPDLMPLLPFFQ